MKPSRYNFVFPYQFNKDYSVVYNSFNDTVGIVTVREAEYIRTCDISLGIHNTKIEDFKKKGFVIDENTSELSRLKVEYLKQKFDPTVLSVVIVPTYQCNLDCENCYEKLSYSVVDNTIMSERMQDNIFRWIEKNLDGVKTLEISWHGGEPLVAFDAVKRLGGKLKRLADDRQIEYQSKMSTNGYLLTEAIAKELQEIGVTHYKMSLDGCRERNDARRRSKEGAPTYDVILDHIEKSAAYLEEVDLRINVDKEDLKDAYEIMKVIEEKGLSGKVVPRLGKPMQFADQPNDLNFTKEEFSCEAVLYSLQQGIGPKNFSREDCFCIVNRLNGFIVDGHGMLFKCVADSGDGENVGKLKEDGTVELNKSFYAYGIYNPTETEPCESCPYLPICIGECAFERKETFPCTFGSLEEKCWGQFLNAYVVKRLLNRLKTTGFSINGDSGINIDQLIMGKYDEKATKFIHNAASTYLLGDLAALAEKNDIHMSSEDMELLLQLIQPTELVL